MFFVKITLILIIISRNEVSTYKVPVNNMNNSNIVWKNQPLTDPCGAEVNFYIFKIIFSVVLMGPKSLNF